MSKYDFARRLKHIVQEECEIIKTETKIAQKSIKYNEEKCFLKSMLAKQELELVKCRKDVEKLIRENDKLEKCKQLEEDRLCALIQKVEQIQGEHYQTQQRKMKQRRRALLEMNCIRNIKVATQTYINLNALPQLVQGVTINETDSSSEWKPFRIDPSRHTQKEVTNMIWHESQIDTVLKKTWETLIFCEILGDEFQCTRMEQKA